MQQSFSEEVVSTSKTKYSIKDVFRKSIKRKKGDENKKSKKQSRLLNK